MANLSETVDSLENRISKLLHKFDKLKRKNRGLEEELDTMNAQKAKAQVELDECREKCRSLKLANSMLGSDQHKRETKLKINALVREIDQCISQLSD
ncbi:MAG: hypothetical protein HKO54_02695 [Flavobacteriaceae bacterium]|nr:hypothetical protein [Flavobacteriaceae bacterium]